MGDKNLSGFFENYMKKESIFVDKKALQSGFIPKAVPHRDEQIKLIAGILAPCLKMEKPSNVFIYGKTGTGKTFITRLILAGLIKNEKAVKAHLDYPVYPTRAIAELNCLQEEMHRILPEITKPVLLIHSKGDGLSYRNSVQIYNLLNCKDKELCLLNKSGHIITEDVERMQVFEKAEKFIRRLIKA